MKTKLQFVITFLFLFTTIQALAVICTPNPGFNDPALGTYTKAAWHHGELIPVIELPEIEISGNREMDRLVGVILRENQTIIVANLPEVLITGAKMENQKYRAFVREGEIVVVTDLPLVEITSDFPQGSLMPALQTGTGNDFVAVAWLPELVIFGERNQLTNVTTNIWANALQSSLPKPFVTLTWNENVCAQYVPRNPGFQFIYCLRPVSSCYMVMAQQL